jgi:hypothetical protein
MNTRHRRPSSLSTSSGRGSHADDHRKKKSNAVASSSPPADLLPEEHLAFLPDAANFQLSQLLGTLPLLRLSESSAGLRDGYGGRVTEITLTWHDDSSPSSLFNFLRRQQRLKALKLKAPQLVPCLASALIERPLRFL